jgi:AraC family transcriptional regulator
VSTVEEEDALTAEALDLMVQQGDEDAMLGQIMNMFLLEVINQARNGLKFLNSLLTLLATYYIDNYSNIACLRDNHQHNSVISKDHMRLIDQYIYDHMDITISIDALATELNMNKFHFLNEFKKKLGQTPYQYILTLRIDEAKNLLLNTSDPLTEIALELGFNDGSHFSRTFKKFTGQTPLQFRKTIQ